MAITLCSFAPTVPAGTGIGAPYTLNMNVGTDPVQYIHWRVPPGPRGHLTWYLAQSGAQVLPNTLGVGITADNQSDSWNLDDIPTNPVWTFVGINSGSFNHTVYIDFYTEPIGAATTGTGTILTGFPTADADIPTLWLT